MGSSYDKDEVVGVRHWDDLGYSVVATVVPEYRDCCVSFAVYEIVGTSVGDPPERLWHREDGPVHPNPTEVLADATPYIEGGVKWDGCSNWHFPADVCLHFCEKASATNLGVMLGRCYDWAKELGMDRL